MRVFLSSKESLQEIIHAKTASNKHKKANKRISGCITCVKTCAGVSWLDGRSSSDWSVNLYSHDRSDISILFFMKGIWKVYKTISRPLAVNKTMIFHGLISFVFYNMFFFVYLLYSNPLCFCNISVNDNNNNSYYFVVKDPPSYLNTRLTDSTLYLNVWLSNVSCLLLSVSPVILSRGYHFGQNRWWPVISYAF